MTSKSALILFVIVFFIASVLLVAYFFFRPTQQISNNPITKDAESSIVIDTRQIPFKIEIKDRNAILGYMNNASIDTTRSTPLGKLEIVFSNDHSNLSFYGSKDRNPDLPDWGFRRIYDLEERDKLRLEIYLAQKYLLGDEKTRLEEYINRSIFFGTLGPTNFNEKGATAKIWDEKINLTVIFNK